MSKKNPFDVSESTLQEIRELQTSKIELKPCPFCGAEVSIEKDTYGNFCISHGDSENDCFLGIRRDPWSDKGLLIQYWNARPITPKEEGKVLNKSEADLIGRVILDIGRGKPVRDFEKAFQIFKDHTHTKDETKKDGCHHKKVFSKRMLMSDPPQQDWICSKCGIMGRETIGHLDVGETYADIYQRFQTIQKEGIK